MHLDCKECGARIPAEDMNLENLVARCRRCDAVFSFAAEVGAGAEGLAAPVGVDGPRRPVPLSLGDVPLPRGITVDDEPGQFTIVRRWFAPKIIGLLFFCALWDGFLIVWYAGVLTTGAPLPMVLFPLLHLAVGAGITYAMLAGFLNRTRIEIDPMSFSIRHGPLPWRGNRTISALDIDQLYVMEKVHHGKHGRTWLTFEVWSKLKGAPDVKLLSGLEDRNQALSIEQVVEDRLRIADRPVEGEVAR